MNEDISSTTFTVFMVILAVIAVIAVVVAWHYERRRPKATEPPVPVEDGLRVTLFPVSGEDDQPE